jgi:hypothetical protein
MVERVAPHEIPTTNGLPTAAPLGVDELHELRVRIPVELHRQLLSLKVLRGKSLAETVSLALDIYFSEIKAPQASSTKDDPVDA